MESTMTETPTAPAPEADPTDGWDWAIVEIMGHRRHAGRVREEERFGAKMLRVDVPTCNAAGISWETRYYGGSSIFSYTPTTEETVMRVNKPYEPPARYQLPAPEDDDEPEGEASDADDGAAGDDDDGRPF